jgi:multidrug resistance efflux pump
MKKRHLAFVAAPVIAAGALWFARSPSAASAEVPSVARPAMLVAPGRVEPTRDAVRLSFETSGRIAEILVDEGDAVTAGQVVARLDDRLAKARVAAAEAGLAQAKARYLLARRGPRKEDIAAARADAEAAAATAAHRAAELARSDKLGKAGALADSVVDADGAAAKVADAQASAAKARLDSIRSGTRVEMIEEASASIALAQAELDSAKVALDQTVLRAPTAGTILRRTAEQGALVTLMPPQVVVTLADVKELEIRAEIDEADIASIAVGMPAYATADAYGGTKFPIRIVRVTDELGRKTVRDDDPRARIDTRVLEVIARFDGTPTTKLPLGLRMSVHLNK